MWFRGAVLALSTWAVAAPITHAQAPEGAPPLRLAEAIRRADLGAYGNRGAQGGLRSHQAGPVAAMRGILPTARFEAGYVRTTDPIGAFGTTLRQRAITQQDFDPARLNYPAGVTNYSGGLVLEQPLFNADAWAGRRAARHAVRSAEANADWTGNATRADVIKAYYGAVLAQEKATALRVAVTAAREHVRLTESMAKNGMVTPSDALLASVKAGEVEAMLLEAEGAAATSRLALATVIGTPADTYFTLPAQLPPVDAVRLVANDALAAPPAERADVLAVRAAVAAADADALRAKSLYVPRINGFARYDWNSALRPFGGDNNWTVGVMASWSPFAGASEVAEARSAEGRRMAAEATRDGAEARARLEEAQTATALRVALARLDIAERAVRQSADAHRIVARKYEGGLAPVVELLDAAAIETQARLGFAAARHELIVASAERHKALGGNPAALVSLDAVAAIASTTDHPND
jgi:outer membrane protein TolC